MKEELKFKGEMFEVNLRGRMIMRGRKDKTGLYALEEEEENEVYEEYVEHEDDEDEEVHNVIMIEEEEEEEEEKKREEKRRKEKTLGTATCRPLDKVLENRTPRSNENALKKEM